MSAGNSLVQEAGSVASLVGMLAASSTPWGAGVAIGGQVLAWLFGQSGTTPPNIPTLDDIEGAIAKELADADVRTLLGEANSVWSDIQTELQEGWIDGIAPSDADYDNFVAALMRAVDLQKPDTVHDNTNKIFAFCQITDDKPEGLAYIPAFIWSGTVELYCWQTYTLVLMAQSGAGQGKDNDVNEKYRDAVANQRKWFNKRSDQLSGLLETACTFQTKRLAQVTDVTQNSFGTYGGVDYAVGFSDNGTWPPPIGGKADVCDIRWFWNAMAPGDNGVAKYTGKAQTLRSEYIGKLTTLIVNMTGSDQQETYNNWVSGKGHADALPGG